MKDIEQEMLLNMIGDLINMIDEDGACEHGCSCGQCENCVDLDAIKHKYSKMWEEYNK